MEKDDAKSRDEVFRIFEGGNFPYIKVEIFKDKQERQESPIGTLSDIFECLVNGLIGSATVMEDEDAGIILNHFYQLMKEQLVMSQLILKSRKGNRIPEFIKEILETREGMGSYAAKTPINKIWLDAFEEDINGSPWNNLYFIVDPLK